MKKVYLVLFETEIGPVLSSLEKVREYLSADDLYGKEAIEKRSDHDLLNGDYPVAREIMVDDMSIMMDR